MGPILGPRWLPAGYRVADKELIFAIARILHPNTHTVKQEYCLPEGCASVPMGDGLATLSPNSFDNRPPDTPLSICRVCYPAASGPAACVGKVDHGIT